MVRPAVKCPGGQAPAHHLRYAAPFKEKSWMAGRSLSPGARDDGSALTVGRAGIRAPADRCWRKLVTHVVLTVRCANAAKTIAENMLRTAERRGGNVPPRLQRRHAASAALSGPPHLLRDAILRITEQPAPPR